MRKNIPQIIAQDIFLGIDLDAPALVAQINEHGLAHFTVRGNPSGDGNFAAFGVIVVSLFAGFRRREFIFERENVLRLERLQFCPTLFDQ
jgi:hypothetical protein